MSTITPDFYNDTELFESAQIVAARRVDFTVDFSTFEYLKEDNIKIAFLPAGTVILGATMQQVVPAESGQNGTLAIRSGTTALSAAMAGDATENTWVASVPAALPHVVPASGEDLNLLSNDDVDVRTSGVVRVVLILAEGNKPGRVAQAANRDAIGGV